MLILVELMTITAYTFFLVFSELRWEVIVCHVDIDGIDDHSCLNFLFCGQWVKMRGDCYVDIGGINDHYCLNFLFCGQWVKVRGDCYVDIGGINDHYCLNFLFCVQWVKMRGDCFFFILVELMTITA